jgi:glyoxylase-like metal-dependent hydrolase (beta-lactamase superfamily II)
MDAKELVWQCEHRRLYDFKFGKLHTHTGVFINDSSGSAFVIDAPSGSYDALKNSLLKDIKIEALLITHGHWDHIGDDFLFRQCGAKICAHSGDQLVIEHPAVLIPYVGSDMGLTPCKIDCLIEDNSRFTAAGTEIYSRHVPGHSPGDIIFYIECAGVAFVGDTLFMDGIGRCDFFGGDGNLLISSIREKILTLPGDTIIIPGHGRTTTVDHEQKHNEILR